MSPLRDVAVLVGSLRNESWSRKLALALGPLAPTRLKLEIVPIGDMPLYNPDLDGPDAPPSWTVFRDRVKAADAVLFVTPEYNRSIPGALKNALDVGSRPFGRGIWAAKPGAVVSASPGAIGGFGAQQHLRQTLTSVGIPVLSQPEVFIGGVDKLFNAEGGIVNESSRGFLKSLMEAFGTWIEKTRAG